MNPPLDPTGPGGPGLPGSDDAIPLLTEVVEAPRYRAPDLPAALSDVDWSALSRQVQDNVLEQLMRRSEALFEQSLRSTLDAVIERATAPLARAPGRGLAAHPRRRRARGRRGARPGPGRDRARRGGGPRADIIRRPIRHLHGSPR